VPFSSNAPQDGCSGLYFPIFGSAFQPFFDSSPFPLKSFFKKQAFFQKKYLHLPENGVQ
jgi:hypothetical protein